MNNFFWNERLKLNCQDPCGLWAAVLLCGLWAVKLSGWGGGFLVTINSRCEYEWFEFLNGHKISGSGVSVDVSRDLLRSFLALEAMDSRPLKLLTVNSAFHHKVSSVLNRSAEYASKVSEMIGKILHVPQNWNFAAFSDQKILHFTLHQVCKPS